MGRIRFIGSLAVSVIALQILPVGNLHAQMPGTIAHEHLSEVACVDVPPGREATGVRLLQHRRGNGTSFQSRHPSTGICARFQTGRLQRRPRVPTGIVVEEDGRVWLSEFGPQKHCSARW